jgi:hypothetical protein
VGRSGTKVKIVGWVEGGTFSIHQQLIHSPETQHKAKSSAHLAQYRLRQLSWAASPKTLQIFQDDEVQRTDQNGWTELTTDGEQMWVEVERIYEKE